MKKTFLTAMLFFAFLVFGTQSASAQYVNADIATDLLTAEIATNVANEVKDVNNPTYQSEKIEFYTFVLNEISNGVTVANAITSGANRFNYTVNSFSKGPTVSKNPYVAPLHQEIMDLLAD
ncbi:MAG: hypothetical protein AB8F94_16415 [Saprospiraceae bacterium]